MSEQPDVATQVEQDLGHLADLPVADHVDVLTDVHRRLQDALAALDEA